LPGHAGGEGRPSRGRGSVLGDDVDVRLLFGSEVVGGGPLYVAIVTRQVAGGRAHGVSMFLSSSSMKAPFAVTIDDLVVSPASRTAS